MIFWICLLALLNSIFSTGTPIPSNSSESVDNSPAFLVGYRSTIEIVWTCLTIVFASTWVCIHPHVLGIGVTRLDRWVNRGRLFLNALIFPDKFARKAFAEWMGCRALFSEMEKRAGPSGLNIILPGSPVWTHKHAHFIQMGGIVFREAKPSDTTSSIYDYISSGTSSNSAPLLPRTLGNNWFQDFNIWDDEDIRNFFSLNLTVEQIEDKSKADGLGKSFVVIQCLWFLVQCIGRVVYGIPVTELEVTCLAFIACNIAMYCFWWNKPLNLDCPIEIERSRRPDGIRGEMVPKQRTVFIERAYAVWHVLWTGDIGYLIHPSQVNGDFQLISTKSTKYPVHYFYTATLQRRSYDLGNTEWSLWTSVAYNAASAIFGALHSIAWYGDFPSAPEQAIWRAASVMPAAHFAIEQWLLMLNRLSDQFEIFKLSSMAPRVAFALLGTVLMVLHCVSTPLIFAARFVFIILPLLQLRRLPVLAHQSVPWSNFLPHV